MIAAGVLYHCPATNRVLLLRRAAEVDAPGAWSVPGGKLEAGEEAADAAAREAREELGSAAPVDKLRAHQVDHAGDGYVTFLREVDEEFEPELNNEHDAWRWWPVGEVTAKADADIEAGPGERWVTIKGNHVLVKGEGPDATIVAGFGGKFNGQKLSSLGEEKPSQPKQEEKPTTKPAQPKQEEKPTTKPAQRSVPESAHNFVKSRWIGTGDAMEDDPEAYQAARRDVDGKFAEAFAAFPKYKGIVYRGMALLPTQVEKMFVPGKKFDIALHSSASKHFEQAQIFAEDHVASRLIGQKPVVIRAYVSKGVDLSEFSHLEQEQEVVIPKGTKLTVTDVYEKKGIIRVLLNEE